MTSQRERNFRAAVAWRIFAVGDAITRLARRISDETPVLATEVDAALAAGYRIGHRAGSAGAR